MTAVMVTPYMLVTKPLYRLWRLLGGTNSHAAGMLVHGTSQMLLAHLRCTCCARQGFGQLTRAEVQLDFSRRRKQSGKLRENISHYLAFTCQL